jgi:hypothetical protein
VMGLSKIDLMLMHAPGERSTRADTWRALEDAQAQVCFRGDMYRTFAARGTYICSSDLHMWLCSDSLKRASPMQCLTSTLIVVVISSQPD